MTVLRRGAIGAIALLMACGAERRTTAGAMQRIDDAPSVDRVGDVIATFDVGASPAGVGELGDVLAVRVTVRNAGPRAVTLGPAELVVAGAPPSRALTARETLETSRALTARETLEIGGGDDHPVIAMDPQDAARRGDFRRLPDEEVTPDLETGRYRLGYSAATEMEPFREATGERAEPPAVIARRLKVLPLGVLDAGTERDGYVYFRRPERGMRRGTFRLELRDARSGARIGVATVPVPGR